MSQIDKDQKRERQRAERANFMRPFRNDRAARQIAAAQCGVGLVESAVLPEGLLRSRSSKDTDERGRRTTTLSTQEMESEALTAFVNHHTSLEYLTPALDYGKRR